MLSSVEPWDLVAEGYSKVTMSLFQGYVGRALQLAKLSRENRILDVACGPGTLALEAAGLVDSVDAIDFSESMIRMLGKNIEDKKFSNIKAKCGDGQNLPYKDSLFDAAFSMFGLMFFSDRMKGYSEIYRTLKPGGRILVSSWAPVSQSPAMQVMFGAVRAMKPEMPELQTDVESLENADFFKNELKNSGFRNIETHLVTKEFPVVSIEHFWRDMIKGSAPIVMMKNNMQPDEWKEKEKIALQYLEETLTSMPTSLSSDAWLGYGIK